MIPDIEFVPDPEGKHWFIKRQDSVPTRYFLAHPRVRSFPGINWTQWEDQIAVFDSREEAQMHWFALILSGEVAT